MKRVSVLLLLLVFVSTFSLVLAADTSDVGEDLEVVRGVVDKLPIDEQGRIDEMKLEGVLGFGKTKAEGRIEKINLWLEENVGWLSFIFRMAPEIGWVFALNIYFILLFAVVFGFNGDKLWVFIENGAFAQLFGFAMFLILLFLNVYVRLSVGLFHVMVVFFTTVLPATLMWAAIGIIVMIILLVVLGMFVPGFFVALGEFAVKKMESRGVGKIVAEAKKSQEDLAQSAREAEAYSAGVRGGKRR